MIKNNRDAICRIPIVFCIRKSVRINIPVNIPAFHQKEVTFFLMLAKKDNRD